MRRGPVRRVGGLLLGASLAATAAGGVIAVAGPQAAGADDSGAFSAIASASSFRVLFGSPGRFAVDYYIDGGAPVAQAVVNGLGTSTAFASAPYPGETAVAGPGLVAGFTGLPNPGNYPLYVATSYPSKTDNNAGMVGYDLKAHSEEASSTATAASGGSAGENALLAGKATSTASRDDSGAVKANSQSDTKPITIGDTLRIANATATASVVRAPGAEPVRTADFSATGVSIAGQAVGLTEKGFTVAGTNAPLPDSSPLRKALSERGITVTYLHQSDTPEGVVSPGLMITQTGTAPDGGPATVFQVALGQAVAYVTNSAVAGIPAPAANAGATTETDPGTAPGTASPAGPVDGGSVGAGFTTGPIASSTGGPGPAFGFGSGGPGLSSDGTAPQVAASDPAGSGTVALGTGRVPSRLATPASLGRPIHSGSVTGPYLLLVVGGLVATAVSTLLRRKAVQSA
ncbi:MAG: hypothetical protein QOD57_1727 [Actinomycetota bacterium]|nr:hypothetical protein [Actinomycetota bacterium]